MSQKHIRATYPDGDVVLSNIRDKNTDETFTYSKVVNSPDGTVMVDAKVDNSIYRKQGSEYFKRNFTSSVNAKWFGAVGDGVTDDTVSIQKAFDYIDEEFLGTQRGATIYFPSGVYIVDQIVLRSRLKILGDGKGVTIIKLKNGSNKSVIFKPKSAWLNAIEGITVDGNKANNTLGHGIEFEANSDADGNDLNAYFDKTITRNQSYTFTRIQDVVCANCVQNGMLLANRNYLIAVSHFTAFANNGHGIENHSTDNFFSDVVSERNGLSGIYESGGNNKWSGVKTIWNGTVNPAGQAGFRDDSARASVINCESQDNWCDGFRIESRQSEYVNAMADGNGYANPGNFSGLQSARTFVGFRLFDAKNNKIRGTATNYRGTHTTFANRTQERAVVEEGNCYGNDIQVTTIEQNQKSIVRVEKSRSDDFYIRRAVPKTVNLIEYGVDEPILIDNGLKLTVDDTLLVRKTVGVKDTLSIVVEFEYTSNTGDQARLISLVNDQNQTVINVTYVSNTATPYLFLEIPGGTGRFLEITLIAGIKYKFIYCIYNRENSNTREYYSIARLSETDVLSGIYPITLTQNSVFELRDVHSLVCNESYGQGRFDVDVQRIHISSKLFDKTNHFFDFIPVQAGDLFVDFQDYRKNNKKTVYSINDLPEPQEFYRGMKISVENDGQGDAVVTCIRNPNGTYVWADYSSFSNIKQTFEIDPSLSLRPVCVNELGTALTTFNRSSFFSALVNEVSTNGTTLNNIVLLENEHVIVFTGTGATITGIQGWDRKELLLINISSGDITLSHQNAAGDASNRFVNPGEVNFVIAAGLSAKYIHYNDRWRKIE